MKTKRKRDVAHLWSDKRVIRFFRKNFNKIHYKNLRSVYLALCEIDSDFQESGTINAFTKTVAAYAGMNKDTIRPYLRALKNADIINYEQQNAGGRFQSTALSLFLWEENEEDLKTKLVKETLSSRRTKNPVDGNPSDGKPADGYSGPFKNNSRELVSNKNPKGVKASSSSETKNQNGDGKNKRSTLLEDDGCPYEKIRDLYHDNCPSFSRIKILSENRKKTIKARWKQYGMKLAPFKKLFRKAESSEFLKGNNDRSWHANFDWLLNEANMTKTLEGRYNNAHGGTSPRSDNNDAPVRSLHELIKDYFPNETLREAFTEKCYIPAERLFHFRDNASGEPRAQLSRLAQALLDLHARISQIQGKHFTDKLRQALPEYGPINIVQKYVDWIGDNEDWITSRKLSMFTVDHGLFRDFCRRWAFEVDYMARSPLTGKSFQREK